MAKKKGERFLVWATTVGYFLIALEVLFMITPFAIYFYGVYGPILEWLSSNHLTAWTTEFFMPHMVFVDDSLLNLLSYLQALFVIGLALFLMAAVPLYFGRLTGKGVVSFGPYSRLRHPQYLALAISGFGLLLYWPRFIVLIFYVTMLFVYYLLARNEEWRMKKEQPGNYEEYMERTWMFLPGEPGGKLFASLFGWIKSKGVALSASYLVVMTLSIVMAFGLREYTLEHLPQTEVKGVRLVSVYPRPTERMQSLYALALTSSQVRDFLKENPTSLIYILPGDFFLTGLILREGPRYSEQMLTRFPYLRDPQKNRHKGDLVKFFRLGYKFFKTIGTTRRVYDYERLVFVKSLSVGGKIVNAKQSLQVGVMRLPSLVVDIDAETDDVLSVSKVSGDNAWGRLPMPNF